MLQIYYFYFWILIIVFGHLNIFTNLSYWIKGRKWAILIWLLSNIGSLRREGWCNVVFFGRVGTLMMVIIQKIKSKLHSKLGKLKIIYFEFHQFLNKKWSKVYFFGIFQSIRIYSTYKWRSKNRSVNRKMRSLFEAANTWKNPKYFYWIAILYIKYQNSWVSIAILQLHMYSELPLF